MKWIAQILCLCWLFPSLMTGQFADNFTDGDLSSNPTWFGDITDFKVNDIGQLQLDAEDAGEKQIYIPITVTSDFTWKMDVALDFAPSNNNRVQVFFFISDIDPTIANGFYFEYGQNLAEDNLKFYRLDAGIPILLGEGELGALAEKTAELSLQIDRVEGLWTISTDYSKQGFPVEEFLFMDDTYQDQTDGYFRIFTKFTSSNADAFFFDNFEGKIFVPDTEGPKFTAFELLGENQLMLRFDEEIDAASLSELSLTIDPTLTILNSTITGSQSNELLITFNENFSSGPTYSAILTGLTDILGNEMNIATFSFSVPVQAKLGDIVINEILFDPAVGGVDFIELINKSEKILELEGLVLSNSTKEGSEENIEVEMTLLPGEIIAITKDIAQTQSDYNPPGDALFAENDIPTLNQGEGNVTLSLSDGTEIDSYDYSEDQHLSLLDDTKGVSLERIFPNSASVPENFSSGAESTNFATPGYQNANYRSETSLSEESFSLEVDVFSPNEDGDTDQLIMNIRLPQSGYLSTIRIFNLNGQLVRTLQNNQVTGQEDIARWDGEMDDGGRAAIGHYIVDFQAFRETGEVIRSRKHVKLLDFLD